MTLRTRLTDMLAIEHPIISAPMAFAAGVKLAAALTAAGRQNGNRGLSRGAHVWGLRHRPQNRARLLQALPGANPPKYDAHRGVVVFDRHDPLAFDEASVVDLLDVGRAVPDRAAA